MQVFDVKNRFFILTGGPGSGKSTLIHALEQNGYACSIEAGRGIIQDQVRIDANGLPWRDPALFAELMLSWEMRSYQIAQSAPGTVFFDRGVLDVVAYLRLTGVPVPHYMRRASNLFQYSQSVFIAPPWKEIFHEDRERKQTFEEAVRTYETLVQTYREYDYKLVEIPRVSVDERVRFILNAVGASNRAAHLVGR